METVTPQGLQALRNSAKSGMLFGALLGDVKRFAYFKGFLNAVNCIERGVAAKAAAAQASRGGYLPPAAFDACWAELPDDLEQLALTDVQQFLRSFGLEITLNPVSDVELDAVVELEDKGVGFINAYNEHPALAINVHDGSGLHKAPPERTIVASGGAA